MPARPNKPSDLERARAAYSAHAWDDAYVAFSAAESQAPLAAADVEKLGWAATLTGRDEESFRALERLYQLRLDAGDQLLAARAAFFVGIRMRIAGEHARANGWLARAQRLVEGKDCAETGYLLLAEIRRLDATGDFEQIAMLARRAVEIGDRFADKDLSAFARALSGRAAMRLGQTDAGFALLDEAMLSVTTEPLSPMFAGLIYCIVIAACHQVYALARAREWTEALARWCAAQSQLVQFTGACAVHRVELMQLGGEWGEAIEAARAAAETFRDARGEGYAAVGDACYQEAEIRRLRGEHAAAETAYRSASERGRDAQPGLALLRLAQGRIADAVSSIRTALAAVSEPLRRVRYLPASVEILLAAGEIDEARMAARELASTAAAVKTDLLGAMAAHAEAAVAAAEGHPQAALAPLRQALTAWAAAGAPYIVARLRVLLARTCHDCGDADAAALELGHARIAFLELGAAPDIAALDAVAPRAGAARPHGLSQRELEVLRLVATGKTNKAIARELHLSEKTVDRHVSNIFSKTNVASRAAATAYAYQQRLV